MATTFEDLMQSIEQQVHQYIENRLTNVITDICNTYNLSYQDVIENSNALKEFNTANAKA